MPSPIAHSLVGIAVNRAIGPKSIPKGWLPVIARTGIVVFASNGPDLDFLPGILVGEPSRFHHGPLHSLLAGIGFGLLAALVASRFRDRRASRTGFTMALLYCSHLLLDMMSSDDGLRNGVPLFWPVYSHALSLPLPLFIDIRHQSATAHFVATILSHHNAIAVAWELVVLGAIYGLVQLTGMALAREQSTRRPLENASDGSDEP
jgi:membrane-bound metal-dependent hydrolase YbcI (DUF457 family)